MFCPKFNQFQKLGSNEDCDWAEVKKRTVNFQRNRENKTSSTTTTTTKTLFTDEKLCKTNEL